jgi:hypothetical protein
MELGSLHIGFVHSIITPILSVANRDARLFVQSVGRTVPRKDVPSGFREGFGSIRQCVLQLHDAVINIFVCKTVWELQKEFVGR